MVVVDLEIVEYVVLAQIISQLLNAAVLDHLPNILHHKTALRNELPCEQTQSCFFDTRRPNSSDLSPRILTQIISACIRFLPTVTTRTYHRMASPLLLLARTIRQTFISAFALASSERYLAFCAALAFGETIPALPALTTTAVYILLHSVKKIVEANSVEYLVVAVRS